MRVRSETEWCWKFSRMWGVVGGGPAWWRCIWAQCSCRSALSVILIVWVDLLRTPCSQCQERPESARKKYPFAILQTWIGWGFVNNMSPDGQPVQPGSNRSFQKSVDPKFQTDHFSSTYQSGIFFSLYQPITSNACICCVCACMPVCMHACVCMCMRASEWERESVCVCVRERGKESVCDSVSVCVCVIQL